MFKYDLGIEIEGKFHAKIHRDSLKPNEYQIFQTKEEWGGFDGLEIRYSDKSLANTNTLNIQDTQMISIVLEEHEEVDVKVCCVDSQSIKVGLFNGLSSHFHNLDSWQDARRDRFSEVLDNLRSTFNEFDEAAQEQIAWLKERIRVLEQDY